MLKQTSKLCRPGADIMRPSATLITLTWFLTFELKNGTPVTPAVENVLTNFVFFLFNGFFLFWSYELVRDRDRWTSETRNAAYSNGRIKTSECIPFLKCKWLTGFKILERTLGVDCNSLYGVLHRYRWKGVATVPCGASTFIVKQSINQNTFVQRHMSRTNQRRVMAETRLSVHVHHRQYQIIKQFSF